MRISDWSSDVCSSDLSRQNQRFQHPRIRIQTNLHDAVRHWEDAKRVRILIELRQHLRKISFPAAFLHFHGDAVAPFLHIDERRIGCVKMLLYERTRNGFCLTFLRDPTKEIDCDIHRQRDLLVSRLWFRLASLGRSEEHTSELQSLMRIS